jgi:hypothetical protein
MTYALFANNAATGLVYPINSTQTTIYVNGGSGSLFPSPSAGNYFPITFVSQLTGNMEIAYCTARSGDVFTITRGQEGTTAQAFAVGDAVQLRITAGSLNSISNPVVVSSLTAGTGISVSASTGPVTVTNIGVTSLNATAGSGITLSGSSGAINITANTPTSINTGAFSITEVSGKLVFNYGATTIASLDSSGNFTTIGNHVASGTP